MPKAAFHLDVEGQKLYEKMVTTTLRCGMSKSIYIYGLGRPQKRKPAHYQNRTDDLIIGLVLVIRSTTEPSGLLVVFDD